MNRTRRAPTIVPLAVIAGVVLAFAVGTALAPAFGIVATILGSGAAGSLASFLARKDGLFQGLGVGIGLVVIAAAGGLWGSAPGAQTVVADFGATLLLDLAHLAAACAGGFVVRRD